MHHTAAGDAMPCKCNNFRCRKVAACISLHELRLGSMLLSLCTTTVHHHCALPVHHHYLDARRSGCPTAWSGTGPPTQPSTVSFGSGCAADIAQHI